MQSLNQVAPATSTANNPQYAYRHSGHEIGAWTVDSSALVLGDIDCHQHHSSASSAELVALTNAASLVTTTHATHSTTPAIMEVLKQPLGAITAVIWVQQTQPIQRCCFAVLLACNYHAVTNLPRRQAPRGALRGAGRAYFRHHGAGGNPRTCRS